MPPNPPNKRVASPHAAWRFVPCKYPHFSRKILNPPPPPRNEILDTPLKRYDSLPTLAAKYTGAQNVLTVTKRVERAQSIVIIKHKYMMLMCNHKIRINIMRRLRNSTVGREIGQWSLVLVIGIGIGHWSIGQIGQREPHTKFNVSNCIT